MGMLGRENTFRHETYFLGKEAVVKPFAFGRKELD